MFYHVSATYTSALKCFGIMKYYYELHTEFKTSKGSYNPETVSNGQQSKSKVYLLKTRFHATPASVS